MKILKSEPISPFGGLNFVIKHLDQHGIGEILEESLPALPAQCRYGWRDIFYCFWSLFYCGGDCAEDLSVHFKHGWANNPLIQTPSPDRLLSRMKQLATAKQLIKSPRKGSRAHGICLNHKLIQLNLKLLKQLALLKPGETTLDFDHTMLFANKADAKMTYKKQRGYNPAVGLIHGKVVYVENRNGNLGAHILQQHSLHELFSMLNREGIQVKSFRADSASYTLDVLSVVQQHVEKIYVRARMCQPIAKAINAIENWEKVTRGSEELLRGEISFTPFTNFAEKNNCTDLLKEYRLIVTKAKRMDGQINLFTNEACNYGLILTSDWELTPDQAVQFYDQRGAAEKEFDILKNDFGWNNMPFSKIEHNTVFLLFSAMARNIYAHLIQTFSLICKGLKPNFRVKKFIFRFNCIPAKWVRSSRSWHLRVYGQYDFPT